MRQAIAIGMLGLAIFSNRAAAQTAVEQAAILRDFQRSVVDYSQRHKCLAMFPEALSAASPAPKIFTLPVAMVFRQLIAGALSGPEGGLVVSGTMPAHRVAVLMPLPADELSEFPGALRDALPALPDSLEYRLVDHDLVIRDLELNLVVAVLPNAVGMLTMKR
jgi:hypothetical protein